MLNGIVSRTLAGQRDAELDANDVGVA